MEYFIKLGEVRICLRAPVNLLIEESIIPFLCPDASAHCDVMIEFSHLYHLAPRLPDTMAGEDLLLAYYPYERGMICAAKGGPRGPLAISISSGDYAMWTCYLNTQAHDVPASIGNYLRLVPMPVILQSRNALLLHASQMAVQGRGILFTAPSGTGKSTQARLWRDHRGGRIICNDRTLVHNGRCFGYPMDGSEPVCSAEHYPLAAIVVLGQSPQNRIRQLKPSIALASLMPQVVFHSWDPGARNTAAAQLISLIGRCPVYQLCCTPDEDAVICLENRLKMDGVIS